MKTAKRLAAFILALCLLIGIPFAVSAAESAEDTKLLYAAKVPKMMADKWKGVRGKTGDTTNWLDNSIVLYFNNTLEFTLGNLTDGKGAITGVKFQVLAYDADGKQVMADKIANPEAEWSTGLFNSNFKALNNGTNDPNMANPLVITAGRTFTASQDRCTTKIDHFRVVIRDDNGTSPDGYIDGLQVNGEPIKAETTYNWSGQKDAIIIEVEEREEALIMNSLSVVDDNNVHVSFTEAINPITVGDPKYTTYLRIVNFNGSDNAVVKSNTSAMDGSVGNSTRLYQYTPASITMDADNTGFTATFNNGQIEQLMDCLQKIRTNYTADATKYRLAFCINENGGQQDASNGEHSANFFIDAIRGLDSNKPLYVNYWGRDAAYVHLTATAPTSVKLIDSKSVLLTMPYAVQLRNAAAVTVNGASATVVAENETSYDSVWTLTVADDLTGEVTVAVGADAFYDVKESTLTVAEAKIGDVTYSSLDKALEAAKADDTVVLMDNVSVSDKVFVLDTDVNIDLNGYALTVNNLMAFGHILDSADGEGKLIVAKDKYTVLMQDNETLPLYDGNGYRFFSYEFMARQDFAAADSSKYAMHLGFTNNDAYALLKSADNADLEIGMNLTITKADGSKKHITYTFSAATIEKYANASAESTAKKAIALTVYGLAALGEVDIDAQAFVESPTNFEQARACALAQ